MVFLVVKGTVYPDEFVVERKLTDLLSPTPFATSPESESATTNTASSPAAAAEKCIVPAIAHTLNVRHHLRLVLMSARELATLFAAQHQEGDAALLESFTARIEELQVRLKDATNAVQGEEFEAAVDEMRAMASSLYPSLCTHPEGVKAAVDRLYSQHEDPDLDEDTRLLVYHCRAVLDPEWKSNERVKEDAAALWFCGKPMEGTLAKYAGRNEKSKIIVKVAPRAGPAPSGEPRMRYEDQRALYQTLCQRRETYKQLETSELRDRVMQQTRGVMRLPNGGSGGGSAGASLGAAEGATPTLRTEKLRPIYARKEEREVPIA